MEPAPLATRCPCRARGGRCVPRRAQLSTDGNWPRMTQYHRWMARGGGGMQHVELPDVPTDDAGSDGEQGVPLPPRRRRWWLVPGAAAAVVLALVAYQIITDARERSLLAGLADVPGVLAPIDPDLPVRWDL